MSAKTWVVALAVAATAGMCGWARADVTGKVTLEGKAPEMKVIDMSGVAECNKQHPDPVTEETVVADDKGNLANVVVYVKKEEGQEIAGADKMPTEAAVLDQKGCQYSPHVMAVMVGQEVKVKNDDGFLHNVHSLAQENPPFNFGQPNKDQGKAIDPMKTPETFKVKCDVHPWMLAWFKVFDHPFFAVTDESGAYKIKGLPDGEYTFMAWQEKYGDSEPQKVKVEGGKAEVNFKFKAESAMATPAVEVKLASLTQSKDGACCEECVKDAAVKVASAPAAKAAVATAK